MNMSSSFIGNTLAFFLFRKEDKIEEETKTVFTIILMAVSGVGTLLILTFRPTPWAEKSGEVSMVETLKVKQKHYAFTGLQDSWKLLLTRNMSIFCITLFFTGLNQSIWGGVYTTCIGFTME